MENYLGLNNLIYTKIYPNSVQYAVCLIFLKNNNNNLITFKGTFNEKRLINIKVYVFMCKGGIVFARRLLSVGSDQL